MTDYFQGKGCDVKDVIYEWNDGDATLPKAKIMEKLRNFKQIFRNYLHGIIYYTGHGYKGTGNWVAADNKEETLKEVAEIFRSFIGSCER